MDNVTPGQRLAQLREAAGLLQRHVGERFNIDKAAVSEWERDRSNPSRERLLALDEMYGADGEVLRLYGVAPDTAAQLSQLRSEVADLRDELAQLRQDLEAFALATEAVDLQAGARFSAIELQLATHARALAPPAAESL